MNEQERLSITKYDLLYEQRITRVETVLENLSKDTSEINQDMKQIKHDMKTDFRWLFALIMGSNAGMFALMAHGFKWF